jgi:mannose PTS system EIIA component
MARLFIVAHAPLASALRAVAQHAYPDCGAGTDALDVLPGDTAEAVEARIRAQLAAPGEVLILADVFGATPCNAALAAADGTRVRVVAGVSVPMLWRTLCYQSVPLDDLVTRAVAGGSQGAMHVAVPRRQNQAASAHHHDQDPHHDQQ